MTRYLKMTLSHMMIFRSDHLFETIRNRWQSTYVFLINFTDTKSPLVKDTVKFQHFRWTVSVILLWWWGDDWYLINEISSTPMTSMIHIALYDYSSCRLITLMLVSCNMNEMILLTCNRDSSVPTAGSFSQSGCNKSTHISHYVMNINKYRWVNHSCQICNVCLFQLAQVA